MVVRLEKGTKDGLPVWWVVSVTRTGTHRLAACEHREAAEAVAKLMQGGHRRKGER